MFGTLFCIVGKHRRLERRQHECPVPRRLQFPLPIGLPSERRQIIAHAVWLYFASIEGGSELQKSAELLSVLSDQIDAMKSHISQMSDLILKALAASLPSKAPAGTAEMLMLLLIIRETEGRARRRGRANVLPLRTP